MGACLESINIRTLVTCSILSIQSNKVILSHWEQTSFQRLVFIYIWLRFQLRWIQREINKKCNRVIGFKLKVKRRNKNTKFPCFEYFLQFHSVFHVDSTSLHWIVWLKLHGKNVDSTSFCPVGSVHLYKCIKRQLTTNRIVPQCTSFLSKHNPDRGWNIPIHSPNRLSLIPLQ